MQRLKALKECWLDLGLDFDTLERMDASIFEKITIVFFIFIDGLAMLFRIIGAVITVPIWIVPYLIYKTIKEKAGK